MKIVLRFDAPAAGITAASVILTPATPVLGVETLEDIAVVATPPLNIATRHSVTVRHAGTVQLALGNVWNAFVSTKPLGLLFREGAWEFRVFAPRATMVELCVFPRLDADECDAYEMDRDPDGVWEMMVDADLEGRYYGYRVYGPEGEDEGFDPDTVVADPYGRAVATRNTHRQEARTLIFHEGADIDWGDDAPVSLDPRDAVIYELHVRDMTAHPSSGVPAPFAGTYAGLALAGTRGGLAHLRRLGVNAVELLPCHQFAAIEPPYNVRTVEGFYNSWNPYERNHWGYMTTNYFAPEPSYAVGGRVAPGEWIDTRLRHIREFKEMVRAFHREGIAVIMDVVYNHTSQFNQQPLRYIGRRYYYRTDDSGVYTSLSGCGNDLMTARPMARRLVIDSVLHWMREFHIDGFRFDLATMIDQATFIELSQRAREVNPDVLLIAEPWGGGMYDLGRFSDIGMSAWNDLFRNSVKGSHPVGGRGFVFGSWGWNSPEAYGQWVLGSIREKGGPFKEAGHSVNYLESHDGYTLGDFIRIATGEIGEHGAVLNVRRNARFSHNQLALHKLAALMLLTCQGAVMIAEGQEYARSKVIARRGIPGVSAGLLDHDSYNKDDETNWLNYDFMEMNATLRDYYAGLIAIRLRHAPLRHAARERYTFLIPDAPVASGFIIAPASADEAAIAVLVNPNPDRTAVFILPEGAWIVLADKDRASVEGVGASNGGAVNVPVTSGMVMIRS